MRSFRRLGRQSTAGSLRMKLYVFRCRARPKMYGATRFETASNLPTDRCTGGWEFCERVELGARGTLRFAVDTGTVRRQVQQNGWYVWDESPPDLPRGGGGRGQPGGPGHNRAPPQPETGAKGGDPAPLTNMSPPPTERGGRPPP